ncbi:MAG: ATPase domain-containing protein [Candidatus Altiarchaeota archaeon]|nr:ATPase domain-containing protein [Candidatus Altiarchaeota archaeon]
MQERLKTGIKALDEILDGGIPRGHSIILAGSSGTGKTILAQQFLFSGARDGNIGLYLSLSEPRDKIIKNLEDFTFFDKKLVESDMVKITDLSSNAGLKGVGLQDPTEIMGLIREIVLDSQAKRVVIDSITALAANFADDAKIRNFIYELEFELMYLDCTTLLISEIPPQTFKYSVYGIEEFIADGVILLTEFERKSELLRACQVVKMRGVNHSRSKYMLKILEDGINLIPFFNAGLE